MKREPPAESGLWGDWAGESGSDRLVEAARIELASEAASRKTSTSVVPDLISPWRLPWDRIRPSQSR